MHQPEYEKIVFEILFVIHAYALSPFVLNTSHHYHPRNLSKIVSS